MTIDAESFDTIRPNSQLDGFLARRMAGALWLTTPEAGTVTGGEAMAEKKVASNKCIEPGCTKFRVKNKRCVKHSSVYLAQQQSESPEPQVVKPAKAEGPGAADPRGTAEMCDQVQLPALRSLLHLVEESPALPGFFLDFSGHEELLRWVEALSDDPVQDVLALLGMVKSGELCRRKQ